MEFGWYHEFHRQVPGMSDADAFSMGLDQAVESEEYGLDSFWLAEIHQQAARSVMSAPMTVLAAVAARTRTMKLGTAVQVLPLTHPLRLAEETATLDQMSGGRFVMEVGRSGNPQAYAAYGIPYSESRERFYETLEVLKLAWMNDTFSFHGKFHHFGEAKAVPRPFQKPFPEIRIAGASEDTFPVLGTLGYPLFVAVRSGTLAGLAPDLQSYRSAYDAAGHPGKGQVHLRVSIHVGETDAAAMAESEASIMSGYGALKSQLEGSPNARRRAELADVLSLTFAAAMRDKVIVGSPDTVTARLLELKEDLGIDGILAELNFGAQITPDAMMRSCKLLCENVRPRCQ